MVWNCTASKYWNANGTSGTEGIACTEYLGRMYGSGVPADRAATFSVVSAHMPRLPNDHIRTNEHEGVWSIRETTTENVVEMWFCGPLGDTCVYKTLTLPVTGP